jgi:hypothetical protein
VEESRSTCQQAGCEFEGTDEEVRTHQENCAEGLFCCPEIRQRSTKETMADESAAEESRSTCQHAGCEFEGTQEEV